MRTYAYGFPRIGRNREYKKAIEGLWKRKIGEIDVTAHYRDPARQ
jgi:5-methyltetrahydropteroyltriglutamate--homocysteine methyltransferase